MEVVVRPVVRNNSGAGLGVRAAPKPTSAICVTTVKPVGLLWPLAQHTPPCVDRNKLEQLSAEKRRRAALVQRHRCFF